VAAIRHEGHHELTSAVRVLDTRRKEASSLAVTSC
jgi:hypothetical protein